MHRQNKLGGGPVSGGQLMVSWSHQGRCRREAAFVALIGVSPLPAGRFTTSCLPAGGCAHAPMLTSLRAARGASGPEIRCSLKRDTARELFRALNAAVAH